MEVDVSSLHLNSVESNQSASMPSDVVSPEDLDWADSCLIKDEISQNGWNTGNSHKDAVFMGLDSERDSSAAKWEEFSPSSKQLRTSQILDGLVTEESTEDIFKVWNLDMPDEEDEFIMKLNKAISESSLDLTPPVSEDSKLLKDLEDGHIDDIISGLADLSLDHLSM
ncbi:hypothetical protein ACH5RR_022001 [Cinchona calisaya]|uniref:Uncharacterized protein n=1 Tax=Cinchona calisaya TaxID=153742 RepID=A0ABD2Z6J5_9GENT